MNEKIFMGFVANILGIRICSIANDNASLDSFEQQNCFEKTLQPMYTAEYLHYLLENAKEVFYEITDYLNTNLILFCFDNTCYLLGPYVKILFITGNAGIISIPQTTCKHSAATEAIL